MKNNCIKEYIMVFVCSHCSIKPWLIFISHRDSKKYNLNLNYSITLIKDTECIQSMHYVTNIYMN